MGRYMFLNKIYIRKFENSILSSNSWIAVIIFDWLMYDRMSSEWPQSLNDPMWFLSIPFLPLIYANRARNSLLYIYKLHMINELIMRIVRMNFIIILVTFMFLPCILNNKCLFILYHNNTLLYCISSF